MRYRALVMITTIVLVSLASFSSASWEVVESPAELVRADGLKAMVALGPARCAAAGQVDADGVLDLVTGHAANNGGAVVIYSGDERFRQGVRRDLWRAEQGLPPVPAFLGEATVVGLPFAPDWVAIGDVDADGLADLVCAAHGHDQLAILAGDGIGGFAPATLLTLPGPVAAFAAGEVNRVDSLTDLVVAIDVGGGGAVLVFEDPAGASRAQPEWFPLTAPATGLALGRLDDDPWIDIAVAADEVAIIFGRDRRLAEARAKRDRVAAARTEIVAMEAPSYDLAFGHFVEGSYQQLAVRREDGAIELFIASDERLEHRPAGRTAAPTATSARMVAALSSGRSTYDLVLASSEESSLSVFGFAATKAEAPALEARDTINASANRIIAAKLNLDARDDLVLLADATSPRVAKTVSRAVHTVNSTADTDDGNCTLANCTLREAINAANATLLSSSIVMDLSLGATISVTSELPVVSVASLVIDGTVGSSPTTSYLKLDGSPCTNCNGIDLFNGGVDTLTMLAFGGFVNGWDGTSKAAVRIESDNNLVARCLVGLDVSNAPTPNNWGVLISGADNNTVGGSTTSERNVISANQSHGVFLSSSSPANGNHVIGNYIGTNRTGTAALGNGESGVAIKMAGQNHVGTTVTGEGNVIAGNTGAGVELSLIAASASSNSYVLHNLIGVAANGVTGLANGDGGVRVVNQRNTTIGGSVATARNVVGGDTGAPAIDVQGDSVGTVIRGNYVSLGSDGSTPVPPSLHGIVVTSSNVTIGGTTRSYGNVVGANAGTGINIGSDTVPVTVTNTDVIGNVVGTDAGQQSMQVNRGSGVRLNSCSGCVVGDPGSPGSGNVVVGTSHYFSDPGITLSSCDDVQVADNRVGVTDAGLALANGRGVTVSASTDCQIGWGNIIAHNLSTGIDVRGASSGILLLGNSIHSNAELGINLGNDDATPNDPGDYDSGPNNLQNYPVITGYNPDTGAVTATLDSDRPLVTYTVHVYESSVCDAWGYGEGATFLGGTTVVTNSGGDATISVTAMATPGASLTMLASDPDGNTSEFSPCFAAPNDPDLIFADGFESGSVGAWSS